MLHLRLFLRCDTKTFPTNLMSPPYLPYPLPPLGKGAKYFNVISFFTSSPLCLCHRKDEESVLVKSLDCYCSLTRALSGSGLVSSLQRHPLHPQGTFSPLLDLPWIFRPHLRPPPYTPY
ncbi:hypothetical protein CEXT_305171 [Caerostris extrusa]|uniref:Uncharacterized protein n=1 Tax=Caerostris extrusa TaxID=172846 RepID=A0AAV4XED6_CAEEX|nr:hypothetical protein CEXT_305171 [Caerostris extrusa]